MSIVELLYFEFTEYGEIVLGTIKKYVIDHIRMRLMNEFPGCLCQMWGFYERTIISVAFCKPIKVMIRRIAVVSEEKDAFGKRVRKVIKTHALIPNMVLPYFRYAITDQVLAISSGMDIPLKAGISDDEFMQHPDFLYAVSEVQHEKNLDRFYQDDGNADENLKKARRAASRQWHHMQSAKYRESIRRNLVKYEGCYLNDIPGAPAVEAWNYRKLPEDDDDFVAVGYPGPEQRNRDNFSDFMFCPCRSVMTIEDLRKPLAEAISDGTPKDSDIPVFSQTNGVDKTDADSAASTDYTISLMDARQNRHRERKAVPESPEIVPRGIFRFLTETLFLVGRYPAKLLKYLMPATEDQTCFYTPGSCLTALKSLLKLPP